MNTIAVAPRPDTLAALFVSPRLLTLAALAAACAVLGPRLGSPDAAMMGAITLAAMVSSIGGFAFGAICGAMLFHLSHDTMLVVQVIIMCSIANQAAMTWVLRHTIDWRFVGIHLIGAAAGLPLGVLALLTLDRHAYTVAMGGLLVAYALWMLARRGKRVLAPNRAIDIAAGFFGGITGGATGFPSAPVSVWCTLQGWDKTRQRALMQPFILITQVVAFAAITVVKPHAPGHAVASVAMLLCVPGSLVGTSIGMALYQRLSNRQFALAVNLFLLIAGVCDLV